MKDFVKTTIIGGILFLLPVAIVLLVLGHALKLARRFTQPILKSLALDELGMIIGVSAGTLLAVLILVLVSFAAGMLARTTLGTRVSSWFEKSLVGGLPQYRMVKSMAEGLAQIEGSGNLKPALVFIEDGWQVGYMLEPVGDGWVAVFLPAAPTPMSGTLMYLPADRVRPLDISMVEATALVKHVGIGSADALRGVDLSPPAVR